MRICWQMKHVQYNAVYPTLYLLCSTLVLR